MITFEDIQKANKSIKTMAIERYDKKSGKTVSKDYAEVNQRIKAFRQLYPQGFILTDILSHENGVVYMQAKAGYYAEDGSMVILGTGMAFESQKNGLINGTSYIENCETSAVGRALGMCGIGIDMSVASYEEVKNAMAQQEAPQPSFVCAACGSTFNDAVTAQKSFDRWGKHICITCIKKKQAETRKKQEQAKKQTEQAAPVFTGETVEQIAEQIELPFEIQ